MEARAYRIARSCLSTKGFDSLSPFDFPSSIIANTSPVRLLDLAIKEAAKLHPGAEPLIIRRHRRVSVSAERRFLVRSFFSSPVMV
jgi:hypothetical protein